MNRETRELDELLQWHTTQATAAPLLLLLPSSFWLFLYLLGWVNIHGRTWTSIISTFSLLQLCSLSTTYLHPTANILYFPLKTILFLLCRRAEWVVARIFAISFQHRGFIHDRVSSWQGQCISQNSIRILLSVYHYAWETPPSPVFSYYI